jgi:hypothetical protein
MEQPATRPIPQAFAVSDAQEPVTVFLAFLDDEGGVYLGGSLTLSGAQRVAEQSEYATGAATRTGAGIVWNEEPRVWENGTREWTGTIEHDYYSVRETTLS